MQSSRAQASMEYLILFTAVIIIVLALSWFFAYDLQSSLESDAASNAVDSIVKAANSVYARGPCNRETVFVEFPPSVIESSVAGKEINLKLGVRDGVSDASGLLLGNASGYLPASAGIHEIDVEYTCSGVLVIGGGLSLNHSEIRLSSAAGSSTPVSLNLTNRRDVAITSVDSAVGGEVSSWTSVIGLASNLAAGESDEFTLTFDVPAGTPAGAYLGTLKLNGSSALSEARITLNVS